MRFLRPLLLMTTVVLWQSIGAGTVAAEPARGGGTALGAAQGTTQSTTQGMTVITHGFQLSGTRPNWPLLMAAEIAARVRDEGGTAKVLEYRPTQDPVLAVCTDTSLCGVSDASGHSIVVVDWGSLSNQSGRGFSEAAGEALAAVLLAEGGQLDLSAVHFIGHSRGTVVNSEAAERLIATGAAIVDQMTALDTHDWGVGRSVDGVELVPATDREIGRDDDPRGARGGLDDFDVNELHPEYDCGQSQGGDSAVCSWSLIDYVDSYYQRDGFLDLWGRSVQGASNLEFLDLGLSHGDVHCWYRASVSGSSALEFPDAECSEAEVDLDWFGVSTQCNAADRTSPLQRNADGFNASAVAGGSSIRCPDGVPRQPVLFDFFLQEGLVNGDFEKDSDAGWSSNGGVLEGTLSVEGDNRFVQIAQDQELRHSWSLLPPDGWAIDFTYRVPASDLAAELVVTAYPYGDGPEAELWRSELGTTVAEWTAVSLRMPSDLQGTALRIEARLAASSGSGALVELDSFAWSGAPAGLLFDDGFETGSVERWSLVSP